MSNAETRAYRRGWHAGMNRHWPREVLDHIPDGAYDELARAAMALSNAADTFMAQFSDRNEEPHMCAMDAARDDIALALQRAATPPKEGA